MLRMLIKGSRVNRLERVVEALGAQRQVARGRLNVLYWLAKHLTAWHTAFNVFSYLTLRAILADDLGAR